MSLLVVLSVFTFLFGACIGSFLNVVIYRLPRGKSLATPPSSCPFCSYRIPFYLNIPVISWILLRGKCKNCQAPISPRYIIIEFITALAFLALFLAYFKYNVRSFGFEYSDNAQNFLSGGWLIYFVHVILLASLLAASAIDLELWIIPLSLCWFLTLAGIVGSAVSGFVLNSEAIRAYHIFPTASPVSASLALGGIVGLLISLSLLITKTIKPSYEGLQDFEVDDSSPSEQQNPYNDRLEMFREMFFLLPIILLAIISYILFKKLPSYTHIINAISENIYSSTLIGSIWGYLIGSAVVWATRILGTLSFGKEAMGMGDVHLMAAAGAVVGALPVTIAFFIAPFFGLAWAIIQMFFKKTRQIPYGPFLSLALILVMILNDEIYRRVAELFFVH